jgi:acyl-CoA synthetase (NDP forming)
MGLPVLAIPTVGHPPGEAPAPLDAVGLRSIVDRALAAGRTALLETEAQDLVALAGIRVPARIVVDAADPIASLDLDALPGDRVVVKAMAPGLVHKTEVGGVAIVPKTAAAVAAAMRGMAERLAGGGLTGWSIAEHIDHDLALGGELLVGVRWTDDFGPVVTVAAGGTEAEALAADLRPEHALAVVQPALASREEIAAAVRSVTAVRVALGLRGQAARLDLGALIDVVERFGAIGEALMPAWIRELEVNPIAVTPGGLVALDALVGLGGGSRPPRPARPRHKVERLLRPSSLAIVGVSERRNPGRIILDNTLAAGFDPARIWIVKPGAERLAGCRCVPDLAALPERVDLLVVAIAASGVPDLLVAAIEQDRAESIIVIPGGLGETEGSRPLVARLDEAIRAARRRPGGGPVINGGNCLGIRSVPGGYDTFFVPPERLTPARRASAEPDSPSPAERTAGASPLAIVSQSGAFALSRMSRLGPIVPRYVITVGNQLDLTIGDHLGVLADDPSIGVVGVYVEGFVPLDGSSFLAAARRIRARGGTVLLYRGGRTSAGRSAAASHTAAMAGDAVVTRSLAGAAGVIVADTLADFDDLLRTFTLLHGKVASGRRLGAVTNGGFECVAIADNLGELELAALDAATVDSLGAVLGRAGLGGLVDVHNPLDLTPMADDDAYERAIVAMLDSTTVDVGLIGIVPFTTTLATLPDGPVAGDAPAPGGSIRGRLARVLGRSTKPCVAVVDAGPLYDALVAELSDAGVPTFRTADAALRALALYCARTTAANPA